MFYWVWVLELLSSHGADHCCYMNHPIIRPLKKGDSSNKNWYKKNSERLLLLRRMLTVLLPKLLIYIQSISFPRFLICSVRS